VAGGTSSLEYSMEKKHRRAAVTEEEPFVLVIKSAKASGLAASRLKYDYAQLSGFVLHIYLSTSHRPQYKHLPSSYKSSAEVVQVASRVGKE
jgi:hypothetical protein